MRRTPTQFSGGNASPNDCSGTPGSGGTKVKPYCDLDTAILAAQILLNTIGRIAHNRS